MFQLDQLQTLATVAEEGTFEAAAQRLRVTASAVSQRVRRDGIGVVVTMSRWMEGLS